MFRRLAKALAVAQHPHLAIARLREQLNFEDLVNLESLRKTGLLDGVKTVIDAGAHHGAYARVCSRILPAAKVFCFEPVPKIFDELNKQVSSNPQISTHCLGLGSKNQTLTMNVSSLAAASSLLKMTDVHKSHWPESQANHSIEVKVTTLDDFDTAHPLEAEIFLKADVQGFELELLKGAQRVLKKVRLMQLEISFVSLYEGAPKLSEIIGFLEDNDFRFLSIGGEVTAQDTTLPLQGDFIFVRNGIQ